MVLSAHCEQESALFGRGFSRIAGMDEVGRGSLAGPVCVGVAVLDASVSGGIEGLIDSKVLTEKKRLALLPLIRDWCVSAVGEASAEEIDALGMTLALRLAGQRALAQVTALGAEPEALLLDGKHDWLSAPEPDLMGSLGEAEALYERLLAECWRPVASTEGRRTLAWEGPVTMIVKGDFSSAAIAAASVVAKVYRDDLMTALDASYPGYGWAKNKGYGSTIHRQQLEAVGATPLHRLSWSLPLSPAQVSEAMIARMMERHEH